MILTIRTIILYVFIVLILRLLGKRQIAQLQPFELVIILMISELAAVPSQDIAIPLLNGVIPILVLLVVGEVIAYATLKNEKARNIICGKPTIVIEKGKIMESELVRMRYNLTDLLEQLRIKNAPNIADVEYAIMETNGELSVILKSAKRPVIPEDLKLKTKYEGVPYTIISDGKIQYDTMRIAQVDMKWLESELKKANIKDARQVLLASLDSAGNLFIQKREKVN